MWGDWEAKRQIAAPCFTPCGAFSVQVGTGGLTNSYTLPAVMDVLNEVPSVCPLKWKTPFLHSRVWVCTSRVLFHEQRGQVERTKWASGPQLSFCGFPRIEQETPVVQVLSVQLSPTGSFALAWLSLMQARFFSQEEMQREGGANDIIALKLPPAGGAGFEPGFGYEFGSHLW